jgi:hypothetical protein
MWRRHRHVVWTCSMDILFILYSMEIQSRHEAWTCSTDLPQGHAAYTSSMDMQHGNEHGPAACTCIMDTQHGHASRTWSTEIQNGHAARICSMNEQHGKAADQRSFFFMLPRSFWLCARERESAIKKRRRPPLLMMNLQKLHTPTYRRVHCVNGERNSHFSRPNIQDNCCVKLWKSIPF